MITCREVTAWLLEADLAELQTPGDRAIAEHVASCRDCAARASRILGDTASLSMAVPAAPVGTSRPAIASRHSTPPRGRAWYSARVAAVFMAASFLLVLLTRAARTNSRSPARARGIAVASTSPRLATPVPENERARPHAVMSQDPASAVHRLASAATTMRLSSARAVAPVSVIPEIVAAIPTRAVRLDTLYANESIDVEARPSLAVDVIPSTSRYAVLRSTSKVTVVWFY